MLLLFFHWTLEKYIHSSNMFSNTNQCEQKASRFLPCKYVSVLSLQVMQLEILLQFLPLVLMLPSPSNVMLLGANICSPSGEWVGEVIVYWHIQHQVLLLTVDTSQLGLGVGLEQVALHIAQH